MDVRAQLGFDTGCPCSGLTLDFPAARVVRCSWPLQDPHHPKLSAMSKESIIRYYRFTK